MKQPAFYIMTNKRDGVLYTGVTSGLVRRVYLHRMGLVDGFTKHYRCKRLVYFELLGDMPAANAREKQIKAGSRKRKLTLIESMNPKWRNLYDDIVK